MKIVEYLVLFVVEHNVQKVLPYLMHAILKLIIDLDQPVIDIMVVANHHGIVNPLLQALKSEPKLTQSIL